MLFKNKPYHGLESHLDGWATSLEITVFAWKCEGKYFFESRPDSEQIMNSNGKILDKGLHWPNLTDVAVLVEFFIFQTFL